MGGEYLPEMQDDEVEIARVSLKSTTGDQIGIRAKKKGDKIRYRVVDEHDSDFDLMFEDSDGPLCLSELIEFIDGTDQIGYPISGGLIQVYWEDEPIDFVSIESAFYPELTTYYEQLGKKVGGISAHG